MLSTISRAFTRRRTALLCVVPLLLLGCEFVGSSELERPAPVEPKRYNVVPLPRVVVEREGSLDIGVDATISTSGSDPDLERVASSFAERLRSVTGFAVPVVGAVATSTPSVVELVVDPSMADDEGYVLDTTTTRVRISAKNARGIFYGIATLRQLLPSEVDRSGPSDAVAWTLPAVRIEDAPRFSYRGMHLDVSRHFFSVDFVKRYIDLMALYKLNTFHWHLTDDQGWRIDIHEDPRLAEVGSVRKETVVGRPGPDARYDGQPYGGFYTHEQIRDVVAYAADRFVTIVPEIEMPGHSLAALASYPDLACTPGPFETATTWGVFDDVLCPSDGTFTFLTDVLTEVIDLFPGRYVHVGGDEVASRRWEESPVAQEIVMREGLSSAADLGPYFVRRVGVFLESRGRKLVGWDEIAERGDIPGATVMSWRGVDKGVDAVRRGHPVVMTPIEYCYFDHPQGGDENEPMGAGAPLTIEQVYRFDPAPSSLTAPQAALVMGGQANLWTEYIATQPFADYMVFPRMLALAEAVWSPQATRSYPDFLARLTGNAKHLDALSVNYAHQFLAP